MSETVCPPHAWMGVSGQSYCMKCGHVANEVDTALWQAEARIRALEAENARLLEERVAIMSCLACPYCNFAACDEHAEQLEEGKAALARDGGK